VSTIDPLYLSEASLEGLLQQVGKGQVQPHLERSEGRSRATLSMPANCHKPINKGFSGQSGECYGVLWSRFGWGVWRE